MIISNNNTLILNKYYSKNKQTEETETKFVTESKEENSFKKRPIVPKDAPQFIKNAWNNLTQDDKFIISRSILLSTAEANMRLDKDGRIFHLKEGRTNYLENIMQSDGFDINQFIDSWISRNKKNMELYPNEGKQHLKNISALEKFKKLAQKYLAVE